MVCIIGIHRPLLAAALLAMPGASAEEPRWAVTGAPGPAGEAPAGAPRAPVPDRARGPAIEESPVPDGGSPAAEAFARLVARVRAVQRQDLESWHGYAFTRQVVRESLARDGRVRHREELIFRMTPLDSGFDERLIRVDGEEPRPRQVARHRDAARFSERYSLALGEQEPGGAAEAARNAVLAPLSGVVADGGTDRVRGVDCHRLLLIAEDGRGSGSVVDRLAAATEGTVWVTRQGLHVIRTETRLARPVSVLGFIGDIVRLDIVADSAAVEAGVWLLRRVEVTSEVRVLGFPSRKRNTFAYSGYERTAPVPRATR